MILQRDGRLQAEIQKHGCYYFCLLHFANKFTNAAMSAETINGGFYKLFNKRGWMKEAYIMNPQEILNWFGVGCVYTNKHETPDRVCDEREFEILYWKHPEVGGHFTCGDGHGRVSFDPWGVSRAATEGALLSKRIFRRSL